jgi:hypothetical protein
VRLKSKSGAGGPTMVEIVDASLRRDGRGDRGRVMRPQSGARVNALRSARGIAAAPPRVQKCSCDGGGWIVTLDRNRYAAPADTGMLRFTRCICLDYAPSPARSGGAGAA